MKEINAIDQGQSGHELGLTQGYVCSNCHLTEQEDGIEGGECAGDNDEQF